MLEADYQQHLIKKILRQYPGAFVIKTDPGTIQGFPDRVVLYENKWAAFETKQGLFSIHQPNQDYYVEILNKMSCAAFVSPETERNFLRELQRTFGT